MENMNACNVLSSELEVMRVAREINITVTNTIAKVVAECKDREKFWISNTTIPSQVAFTFYHASRNVRIIFEKMHDRFVQALERHENPKVVDQASIVFPELSEMCDLLDSLGKGKITSEMIEFIKKRVRILRNTAQKVGMLPTIEEETKAVNKEELLQELGELADHLRVNLI